MVLGLPDPGKTYSNLKEGKQGTFETAVIGFHDLLAECLALDLLPDTDGGLTTDTAEVVWIYDDMEELRDDTDSIHANARENAKAGIWTPNEARIATGKEETDQEGADLLALPGQSAATDQAQTTPLKI